MMPSRHAAVSALLALGCGMTYRSPAAAVAVFMGGTAIDADHLLDFWLNEIPASGRDEFPRPRGRFGLSRLHLLLRSWNRFVCMCKEYRFLRLYLLAHSWEWIVPFLAFTWAWPVPQWLKAAGLGVCSHMFMDVVGNGIGIKAYSLVYRIAVGFDARRMVWFLPPEGLAYWGSYPAYMRGIPEGKPPDTKLI